jgi:hypothetical protein
MKKHYISPWLVDDDVENAKIGFRAIVTLDGDTVCFPSPLGEDRARLVAAAPVLLDALLKAIKVMDYAADMLEAPEASDFRETIADARAAVECATGVEP